MIDFLHMAYFLHYRALKNQLGCVTPKWGFSQKFKKKPIYSMVWLYFDDIVKFICGFLAQSVIKYCKNVFWLVTVVYAG